MDRVAKNNIKNIVLQQLEELDQPRMVSTESAPVELDQQKVGRLSRMDAIQQQAMSKAAELRRDNELKRLQHVLEVIDDEDYGYCEDCGEAIPLKRLEISPAATRCVSCTSG